MTNDVIRIGLACDAASLGKLCKISYREMKRYDVPALYKICAISKATGILSARRKSIKRGFQTRNPRLKKRMLVSYRGFKVVNGKLRITIRERNYEYIELNKHTIDMLRRNDTAKIRSFTLTEDSLILCITKEVAPLTHISGVIGIDRNLRNVTAGDRSSVTYYDTKKIIEIGETTKEVVRSFKRKDLRVASRLSSKYGRRKKLRTDSFLNLISKHIVTTAQKEGKGIALEDIRFIRSLFGKRGRQGRNSRRLMNNHWPFEEVRSQIEYKAAWAGVPVIHLTKSETRGTSSNCYLCGERLQDSKDMPRQLWCKKCMKWFDRDLVAVMNISNRGWMRFVQSKGIGSETMVSEAVQATVVRRVDPMKLSSTTG